MINPYISGDYEARFGKPSTCEMVQDQVDSIDSIPDMTYRDLLSGLLGTRGRHYTERHIKTCGSLCPEHAHDLSGSLMDEHKGISYIKENLAKQDEEKLNELQ